MTTPDPAAHPGWAAAAKAAVRAADRCEVSVAGAGSVHWLRVSKAAACRLLDDAGSDLQVHCTVFTDCTVGAYITRADDPSLGPVVRRVWVAR